MRQIRSLLYVLCITSMIFIVSLIITQRVYGITVTNPTPNPFNPNLGQMTSISFSVDNTQYVTVKIVNCRSSYVYLPLDDLIHTTWSYSYMNVWGSPDAVTYGQEIIKNQFARIYAYAGQTYTVSWNGKADRGQTDTGSISNDCQGGTYYFVVIPENSPQYKQLRSVQITMYNPSWLAYIRQARTWNPVSPYRNNEGAGPTVSRDSGQGSNCTGFVTSVYWELGYIPY